MWSSFKQAWFIISLLACLSLCLVALEVYVLFGHLHTGFKVFSTIESIPVVAISVWLIVRRLKDQM
jgi:hypothetical protein